MSKQQVTVLIDDDRRLYVKKKDGTEFHVTVFNGGGYYTDLMFQTKEEIKERERRRKENDEKLSAEAKIAAKSVPWYKKLFWPL
ncbi:MAG TPA: hypothetical protein VJ836_00605 [Candidatus Saccharimonadales bacterium]|nr:hypothetical protein [Candidatus Saccharimonadales bacterium]